ncbi:MAG: PEP-CTERM sorting domain-containing protein, partial [Phycisphaerae bacterium]
GTAGGQDEFTTIVELEVDGLIGEILAGDLDADGDVDFDDAELFRAAWLASPPSPSWYDGDFDGDGDVDFADAWAMLDNFRLSQSPLPRGAMGAYLTGEAVPEPTALVLLTMGATSFLAARSRSPRRRRSAR